MDVRSARRRYHRLQLVDHARLDKDASLIVFDRHVERLGEHRALHMGHPVCPVRLVRLQAGCARQRAASRRVAFDQCDEALVEQLLVFCAQAPARRRVALHARAQALVEQNAAGIEGGAANQADVTFQRNMRFVVHDDDLRLLGRNCPEPSPARRRASCQGSQTAMGRKCHRRAALDGENAVIR